jgi:3-deoxy-D-manno-octulosonate 8-phosphate phosphatase (KDO 8-P phosphatase)
VTSDDSSLVPIPGWKPETFILDVDGVMTDGQFHYSTDGKVLKIFGADDHDGLLLLKPYLRLRFVTGDRKGFAISEKRIVGDMKMELDLVSTVQRLDWIRERYDPETVAYMGDGILDPLVFGGVGYSICPANGFISTRERADFVTSATGGNRAVAEACVHLLERFFVPFDPDKSPSNFASSGEWGV